MIKWIKQLLCFHQFIELVNGEECEEYEAEYLLVELSKQVSFRRRVTKCVKCEKVRK